MAIVHTARLTLRPAQENDLEAMHAILSDPRAAAYWSTPPHENLEETRAWLASMIALPPEEGEDFIVECEGRVIGKAGFYRRPEIGFIFHPDVWGKGFAAEALTAVLDRLFALHPSVEAIADVDPRNANSLRLLDRLGFVRSGYRKNSWHIAGEWCDSVDLSLSFENWATRRRIAPE